MKHQALFMLAGLGLATTAQAADVSVAVGADYSNADFDGSSAHQSLNDNGNSRWTGYIDFRHPLLLLPNVNFQRSDFSSAASGVKHDLDVYDLTFYYRPLELDLLSLDLGLDLRRYDGEVNGRGYQHDLLMGYLGAESGLPGTGLGVFGDARYGAWNGDESHDWRVGVSYTLNPQDSLQLKLRGGYRNARLDYDKLGYNFNQRVDGWFMGGELRY
ncbi:TIGR04219 family outer membrane beta-barrel protein [Pseudaeromonas sp. ZJS20]|uniref:TIGR04219 family outer membrane beta-barrel protein n=1 Tax=Pseudaeromonas aegiceratis TaxID=3153928 RepID=UPI00390CD025